MRVTTFNTLAMNRTSVLTYRTSVLTYRTSRLRCLTTMTVFFASVSMHFASVPIFFASVRMHSQTKVKVVKTVVAYGSNGLRYLTTMPNVVTTRLEVVKTRMNVAQMLEAHHSLVRALPCRISATSLEVYSSSLPGIGAYLARIARPVASWIRTLADARISDRRTRSRRPPQRSQGDRRARGTFSIAPALETV